MALKSYRLILVSNSVFIVVFFDQEDFVTFWRKYTHLGRPWRGGEKLKSSLAPCKIISFFKNVSRWSEALGEMGRFFFSFGR